MHLHPFTLAETEKYFVSNGFTWKRLSILQTYMAVGGVPYYLSLFDKTESPAVGLDRLFFSDDAELQKEYKRLFSSLFRNSEPYLDIISLLAKNSRGMTREEISSALKIDNNGKLGDMLDNLIYCDFIRKFNVRNKKIKTNSALYQLTDLYTIFYNTFVSKKIVEEHFWTRNVASSNVKVWYGLAFENEFFRITHRIEAFQTETETKSSIIPTMITTFGLSKGMYNDQIPVQLTMDDLFL